MERVELADNRQVNAFFEDALSILQTATAGPSSEPRSEMAIMIDSAGGLRIVESRGWTLEGLTSHYGARTIYHMERDRSRVRVAGRSGSQTCLLETEMPPSKALRMLGNPAAGVRMPNPAPQGMPRLCCDRKWLAENAAEKPSASGR